MSDRLPEEHCTCRFPAGTFATVPPGLPLNECPHHRGLRFAATGRAEAQGKINRLAAQLAEARALLEESVHWTGHAVGCSVERGGACACGRPQRVERIRAFLAPPQPETQPEAEASA